MINEEAGADSATVAPATEAPWSSFVDLHRHLRPPLRPTASDIAAIGAAIAGCDRTVALLGVTPELAVLGVRLTAFDQSKRMIASVWPGDDARRRAAPADWLDLPLESGGVDAVIGDGSLNAVAESLPELLSEVARVLAPRGRAAFRTFCSPEEPETLDAVRRAVDARAVANFHAYKWRVAMALAADHREWTVPVATIREAVNAMFPDRPALSRRTGWSEEEIDTIDYYAAAGHSISYPPLSRVLETAGLVFAGCAALANGPYPLSERCPTVVLSRRRRV